MPFVYKPRWGQKVDPKRCPAAVHSGRAGFYQCSFNRGPGKEGWCTIHSPEQEEKRKEDRQRRYDELWSKRLEAQEEAEAAAREAALREATTDQLWAELERRGVKRPKREETK